MLPGFFEGFYLLVTQRDGEPTLQTTGLGHFTSQNVDGMQYKETLIIRPDVVNSFISQKFFYGFDEVYLVKELDLARFPKSFPRFCTPEYEFAKSVPDEFVTIFQHLGATRYLSDGYGLNFVCEIGQVESLRNLV